MFEMTVGLALLAISGAFFLAYNHPGKFKVVSPYLMFSLLAVWLVFAVWTAALTWLRSAAIPLLGYSSFMKLEPLLDSATPSAAFLCVALPTIVATFAVLNIWVVKLKDNHP